MHNFIFQFRRLYAHSYTIIDSCLTGGEVSLGNTELSSPPQYGCRGACHDQLRWLPPNDQTQVGLQSPLGDHEY